MNCNCVSKELLQAIYMGSTATFAGMGMAINLVAAPAVMASSDPLPSFIQLYNRGKRVAMFTIFPSAITGVALYYKLDDPRYLTGAVLNLLVIAVTAKLMMPVNNALFALEEKKSDDLPQVKKLLTSWSNRQLVRTLLSVGAFSVGLYAILKK